MTPICLPLESYRRINLAAASAINISLPEIRMAVICAGLPLSPTAKPPACAPAELQIADAAGQSEYTRPSEPTVRHKAPSGAFQHSNILPSGSKILTSSSPKNKYPILRTYRNPEIDRRNGCAEFAAPRTRVFEYSISRCVDTSARCGWAKPI